MPVPNPQTLLTAEGLYVALGGLPILRDVSIRVDAGEAVAILGPNGSGKSTLLRTLVGLVPFQEGQLNLFGTPLRKFRSWRRVGYVPQHASVSVANATVREIVASGRLAHHRWFAWLRRYDREVVDQCLATVGLSQRAGWSFAHLSGGQKQRVLVARALATEPELLVMDEPLAGVDLESQAALAKILRDQRDAGLGLALVLHETEALAEVLDRTVRLCDGRIVTHVDPPSASPLTADPAPVTGLQDPFGGVS